MKFSEPWEIHRLSFLLEKAMSREAKMWRVYVLKKPSSQDTDISPTQRDKAVCWLTELHGRLQLYPETLVLAVSILDRFLASIKARPKYLRCIAIASFFLAVKTCEEDECVPSLKDLVVSSNCGCSPSEILRMEKIILDKLNWDLHNATPLDFLHILRGSMLALALITLELETCCHHWLAVTVELLRKAQIDTSELIRSRELVASRHSTPRASLPPNTVYIYQPLQSHTNLQLAAQDILGSFTSSIEPSMAAARVNERCGTVLSTANRSSHMTLLSPRKQLGQLNCLHKVTVRCKASTKRKVEEMEVDDFYDGIKRLYNEDGMTTAIQEGTATRGLGALMSHQEDSSSLCPPLQPVCAS
ncbi:cyclin-I isoform X2 [Syngnathus acus]|uniref:cyclin-I isoform X2 n=1 Tax=Syngnathus acus TaxID=161584 RepID=UPI001885ECF8|nr:cyclin-I isoform X2 [Syngnathus acus]